MNSVVSVDICILPVELFDAQTYQSLGFASPCKKSVRVSQKDRVVCTPEQMATCPIFRSVRVGDVFNGKYMHQRGRNRSNFIKK